jgi:hypothetical protein
VKNRVKLPDRESIIVFGWFIEGSLTDERSNNEGKEKERRRKKP